MKNFALLTGTPGRVLKFLAVGASGVVVNMGVLFALNNWLAINYKIAGAAGIELSIITNFILNQLWTWNDKPAGSSRLWVRRLLVYNLSMLATGGINYLVLVGLTEYAGLVPLVSNLIGIVLVTVLNYLFHNKITFGKVS